MEPGTALVFTYDFEIPANLPYDTYIAGSFGAFYYNKTDVAVVYESSTADKVSLFTEAGPRLEARLSVDIGDGATIQSYKYLTYTISVVNSGSITAENIYIKAPIPQFTQYVSKQDIAQGDAGYLVEPDTELNFDVGTIYPGEVKEYTYTVRALKDTSSVNTPEEINERSKIKNKIEVTSSLFASSIESNEVVNYITNTVFKTETRTDTIETVTVGQKNTYSIVFENVSEKELNKVKVALVVGDLYQYESATLDGQAAKAKFDEKEGKIIVEVGKLNVNEFKELVVEVVGKNSDVGSERDCYFELSAEGVDAERSVAFHRMIAKSYLVAEDASENIPKQLNEEDKIVVVTKITNNGTVSTTSTLLEITLPDRMAVDSINYNNEYSLGYKRKDGKVNIDLPLTSPDDTVYVTITFIAQNAEGSDDEIVQIVRKVRNENQVDIELNPIEIVVINDKLTLREAAMAEQQAIIDKNTKEAENENKTEEKQEQPNESIPETNNTPQESVVSEPEPRTEEPQEEIRPNEEERNESTPITETNQEETTRSEEQTEAANTAETNKTIDNSSSGTVEDEHHEDHDDHEDHKHNYVISGKAWYDINNNGILDDEEAGVKEVKVYLYNTSNEMVKSTITNHDGTYNFEVEEEKYFIGFKYDESKYQLTPYNKNESEEDRTSKAISVTSDTIDAMTNSMQVGSNIENVNIGLQDKNRFDITINKYISKAIVTTSKNEKTHEFPNLDLTKIEINRKLIDGAKVDLEYVIVIENTGNIEGYAQQVVDYIEPGIEFNEEENKDWYLGTDGNIYTKNLNDELLKPGDKKELRILLHKQMTNDNTGFVLNKVNLLSTFAQENIEENEEGNTSVQTTFIAVSTGRTRQTATYIVMTFVIAAAIYIYMKEFAKSNKTIYKTDTKPKIKNSGKKIYK